MERLRLTQVSLAALVAAFVIGCAPTTTHSEEGGTAPITDAQEPVAMDATEEQAAPQASGTESGSAQGTEGATQAPAPAGGQQGGQRGGFGRGISMAFLLNNDQVKAEINLTEEQSKKIEELTPQRGQGGGEQMTPEDRQKQREETDAKIKAVLKPEQAKRMGEIMLQVQGASAMLRPEVAKELGLSADQSKQIGEALQPPQPAGGQSPGGAGGFDREAFMKAREEANTKVMAILTTDQKSKWEKMQGKKIEIQRGGGGGGGDVVR